MTYKRIELVHHTYTQRRKGTGVDAGETYFVRCIGGNGEALWTSETYTTKRKAHNLAQSEAELHGFASYKFVEWAE